MFAETVFPDLFDGEVFQKFIDGISTTRTAPPKAGVRPSNTRAFESGLKLVCVHPLDHRVVFKLTDSKPIHRE